MTGTLKFCWIHTYFLARILTTMYIIRFLLRSLNGKFYRKQTLFKLSTARSFINCPKIRKGSTFLYAYLPYYYYFQFLSEVTMQQQISYILKSWQFSTSLKSEVSFRGFQKAFLSFPISRNARTLSTFKFNAWNLIRSHKKL